METTVKKTEIMKATDERKKAVIYARISSTGDRQDTGKQIKDLGNYAKSQNVEIVKIYEEHISGAKRILFLLLLETIF